MRAPQFGRKPDPRAQLRRASAASRTEPAQQGRGAGVRATGFNQLTDALQQVRAAGRSQPTTAQPATVAISEDGYAISNEEAWLAYEVELAAEFSRSVRG